MRYNAGKELQVAEADNGPPHLQNRFGVVHLAGTAGLRGPHHQVASPGGRLQYADH